MTLPYVKVTPVEGNARPIGSGENRPVVIGPASGLTKNQVLTFGNINDIASQVGFGPAQVQSELVLGLAPAGFGTVDVVVANASVAGSNTEIENTGTAYTLSGTANNAYDLIVRCTVSGQPDTDRPKIEYSLDGGYSYSTNNRIPASGIFPIPNTGLTITVDDEVVLNEGAILKARCTPDSMNDSDLDDAFAAIKANNRNYTYILIANDDRSPANTRFAKVNSELTILNDTFKKHTQAVMPAGGESRNLVLYEGSGPAASPDSSAVVAACADFAQSTGNFIALVAERARVLLPISRPGYSAPGIPFSFIVGAEYHAVGSDISKNPAESITRNVLDVSYDEFLQGSVYMDEGITAPRSFQGEPGYFVNQSLLKSAPNSTWDIAPKARVTSRARAVLNQALRVYLHKRIRVMSDGTGRIDERDKARIETEVNKVLRAALLEGVNGEGFRGHVSDVLFTLDGESNLLLTSKLSGVTSIVPFAYPTAVETTISLNDSVDILPVL